MNTTPIFHQQYPLSINQALSTVCIIQRALQNTIPDVPIPAVKGAKGFVLFTGASDTALRTAISREKRRGNFIFHKDSSPIMRFTMSEFGLGLTDFYQAESPTLDGLTMAVFQFATSQTKDRYRLKEILRGFGFLMLTQNTYIRSRLRQDDLLQVVEKEHLARHLFLFDANYPSGRTLEKVQKIFDITGWRQKLEHFSSHLKRYLSEKSVDPEDCFNRVLYAGAALHIYIRVNLPPLPEAYFPGKRIFDDIDKAVADYYQTHFQTLIDVYLKHHGTGKM